MNTEAIKELLYYMADTELIIGHQMSQWCGTAPLLEEDLAFSSIAQDKLGHSLQNFKFLEELGEIDPDSNGFRRSADNFHCNQFVELPITDYAFSLMRQFLFDTAEFYRYKMLENSSYEPLAKFAVKAVGELRYHVMHADQWISKLGNANAESISKMQAALDKALPYALGVFEKSPMEDALINEGVFAGEDALKAQWMDKVKGILEATALKADWNAAPILGGRTGNHTEYLAPTLTEMSEVISSESAEIDW